MDGPALSELPLPHTGGARAADWADFNADGKPDLLLATATGPKLLTNQGAAFKDDTALLPKEPYYNVTAAAWLDYDGDKRPDILLSNGFLGLRHHARAPRAGHARSVTSAVCRKRSGRSAAMNKNW